MRAIPPKLTSYDAYDGSRNVVQAPAWGVSPKRNMGAGGTKPLRLAHDRPTKPWVWTKGNSFGWEWAPPLRLATVDVVTLDAATSYAFSVNPTSTTYPGTGTHLTGPADRDLLLVLPAAVKRSARVHVWGYRGIYVIGGEIEPTPTGTVTTLAAVDSTTVWHGLGDPLFRFVPHPDAVDPFVFVSSIYCNNDPSLHGTSGGVAYGKFFSCGSAVGTVLNFPRLYLQNIIAENVPGWASSLNVSDAAASESTPLIFADGGIKEAFLANLDLSFGFRFSPRPAGNIKPLAYTPPLGTGDIWMRNVQLRPIKDPVHFPFSLNRPFYIARSNADITAGMYHQIDLTNVWSLRPPDATDISSIFPTGAPSSPVDRGDYIDWAPFVGTNRTKRIVTGQFNLGEAGAAMIASSQTGYAWRCTSVDQLDGLIAGA